MTTDTLAKLADCPFCGSEAAFAEAETCDVGISFPLHYVKCPTCNASSALGGKLDAGKQQAAQFWNRRALTAQAPAAAEPPSNELILDLDELASDLHYEGNCEMSQEKQDRAALIHRGVRALEAAQQAAQAPAGCETLLIDFIANKQAFFTATQADSGSTAWVLMTQDEDEAYHTLSGESQFHPDPTSAVRAAMLEHWATSSLPRPPQPQSAQTKGDDHA